MRQLQSKPFLNGDSGWSSFISTLDQARPQISTTRSLLLPFISRFSFLNSIFRCGWSRTYLLVSHPLLLRQERMPHGQVQGLLMRKSCHYRGPLEASFWRLSHLQSLVLYNRSLSQFVDSRSIVIDAWIPSSLTWATACCFDHLLLF